MRLKARRARIWSQSYLVYRYLWPNLEAAAHQATRDLPSDSRVVLDIGCGHKPYGDLFPDCTHIGINNSTADASPDIVADAASLPIASASIDMVFCTQVLEHVPRPWLLLGECRRVLRPGGWLLLSAPFYWPIHEEPFDFFRFTRYGLEALIKDAGFADCNVQPDGGDYARLCLSVLHTLPRWMNVPLRLPLNVLGLTLDRLFHRTTLPGNYTVLARVSGSDRTGSATR
jgi:SAM-dependent methyltransferase